MFPLSAFTARTASRLTGLSVRQIHYWDRTQFFTPSLSEQNGRQSSGRIYSFQDVVGLRAIGQLRSAGISLQELRKVRSLFKPGANEDWARRRFYLVGDRLFFTHADAIVASRPLGQKAEPRVFDMGPVVADVKEALHQLPIRSHNEIGRVTRNRRILGGAPVVAGTRIPTATVAWFYRKGLPPGEIMAEFPRITLEDIMAAVEYEDSRDQEATDSALSAS